MATPPSKTTNHGKRMNRRHGDAAEQDDEPWQENIPHHTPPFVTR